MKTLLKILGIIGLMVLVHLVTRKYFPVVTHTTTVSVEYRDTIIYRDSIVTKPVPYKVVEIDSVDVPVIPEDYDSLKTLFADLYRKYGSVKEYKESFLLDTIGNVDVDIRVSKNAIDTIRFDYNYRLYEKIITETHHVYRNNWYICGGTDFNSVSLGVVYSTNRLVYSGAYNINSRAVEVGIGINISSLWK